MHPHSIQKSAGGHKAKLLKLFLRGSLPAKAFEDALHIAVAAHQKIPYLLTWNLRHMAIATMRRLIESVCANKSYKAPIICTPEELRSVQE